MTTARACCPGWPAAAPSIATLLTAALLVAGAAAQEARLVHVDGDSEPVCTVRALVAGGTSAGRGLGFARVVVDNHDDRPHAIVVEISSSEWDDADVRSQRSLLLEANGRARFFLPVAVPPSQGELAVDVDGSRLGTRLDMSGGNGLVGLLICDRPDATPRGLEILQAVTSVYPGNVQQVTVPAVDVPGDWRLFTSFAIVVVDGRAGLGTDAQAALRRYAFAGGAVVVAAPERLPAGPLRELASPRADDAVYGLGHVVALPALGGDTSAMRGRLATLPTLGARLWPAAEDLFLPQAIAGLGEAPVTAFVLVILLFVILVGPVNFVILRRRRQPMLALVTVPLLGFGTTFVILGYGIFHDGLGLRGVVTSWTLLDQARHEAVAVSARTLFAGLAPSALTMPADSLLLSWRAGSRRDEWNDRWHWDADRERLDGGLLPSRTVTPLLSVQQGVVRDRLTLRVGDDETLELLVDGGVQPVGRMALRDLDGGYWVGDGRRLARVPAAEGDRAFRELALGAAMLQLPGGGDAAVTGFAPPTLGEPGSYAARVAVAPWLEGFDLDVDYEGARHFVFGRLHAQDFVR